MAPQGNSNAKLKRQEMIRGERGMRVVVVTYDGSPGEELILLYSLGIMCFLLKGHLLNVEEWESSAQENLRQ